MISVLVFGGHFDCNGGCVPFRSTGCLNHISGVRDYVMKLRAGTRVGMNQGHCDIPCPHTAEDHDLWAHNDHQMNMSPGVASLSVQIEVTHLGFHGARYSREPSDCPGR